jgi:dCMP deaminase
MREWDAYWLERARLNATMSTCRRRHVGAVATRDRRSFADGFNGNLPGTLHCDEGGCAVCADNDRFHRGPGHLAHQCICVHAEQNIVSFCARHGIRLDEATVYCTTQPCGDCLKLLVSSGVTEIVYDEAYPSFDSHLPSYVKLRRFNV